MERVLLDIGSSTVKVYLLSNSTLENTFNKTIKFKDNYKAKLGVSEKDKKELFELIESLQEQNKSTPIKIYATAFFRKLPEVQRRDLTDEVFIRTGLFFNIISHDSESFYLQKALVGKYKRKTPVLLINIGGGSTELVVAYGGEAIEKVNLDFGVGTVIQKYKGINNEYSQIAIEDIVKNLTRKLPIFESKMDIAFYSGGELTYMKLAKYKLKENTLFDDKDHESIISFENFKNKNSQIFETISITELEKLMPENPKWMHGARPCSALAQAICQKYNIKTIIPSDSNLIDGVVRQDTE